LPSFSTKAWKQADGAVSLVARGSRSSRKERYRLAFVQELSAAVAGRLLFCPAAILVQKPREDNKKK
jgi:hypothetical protein